MELLKRTTFEMSRVMEFFTEKELKMQIGHDKKYWTGAIIKELIDNSLDACECSDILPEIKVHTDRQFIEVSDNGPGIEPTTIEKSLDYLIRVSDKSFYVSPTRGQMGNALKTVWAASYVLLGESMADIWSKGIHHRIYVALNQISQMPKIDYSTEECAKTEGTIVKLAWELGDHIRLRR